MARALNLVGKVFGDLTVVAPGAGKYGRPSWHCVCSCGKEVDVGRGNLRSGATTSCGCYSKKVLAERSRTHGLSSTGAYASWSKMMQRCYDNRHPYFSEYGGKGIQVDPSWHAFESFYGDMGDRPAGTTLDRIRNTLGYSKSNCRWATRKEQANNTANNHIVHYRRRRYTLSVLAGMFGIEPATLRKRLLRMPVEKAVQMRLYERC